MKSTLKDIQQALMTGVSYMIPVVVAGGILVALGFLLGGYNVPNDVAQGETFASTIFWSGKIGLDTFMCPVLGAYVAYSLADRPGIAPGLFGGYMALDPWGTAGNPSGFLGALVAGILAGYIVRLLKKIPLPASMKSILPTHDHPAGGLRLYLSDHALYHRNTAWITHWCSYRYAQWPWNRQHDHLGYCTGMYARI